MNAGRSIGRPIPSMRQGTTTAAPPRDVLLPLNDMTVLPKFLLHIFMHL